MHVTWKGHPGYLSATSRGAGDVVKCPYDAAFLETEAGNYIVAAGKAG